jgi:hypothetical protein
MNVEQVVFSVGALSFRLAPLPVDVSLRLLGTLTESLLPAAAAAFTELAAGEKGDLDAVIPKIAAAAVGVPEVFAAFVPFCECQIDSGEWLKLSAMQHKVFARRASLALAWLTECLSLEYADFFTDAGRSLLGAAASRLKSLLGSTGGSGE